MTVRRSTAASALALTLVLGPAAASLAQGTYPPQPPPGVQPTVQPEATPPGVVSPAAEDDEDDVLGVTLPRTGAGLAAAGTAGVALLGGGALLVAGSRRRRQS